MIISEHLNNFEQGLMSNKKTEDTFDTSHPVYRDLVERVGKVDTRLCKTNLEKTSLYENALKEALQNEYPDKHWSEVTGCDIRTTLLESGNDIDKTARKIVESFKVQEKKPAVKKTTGVLAENMRKKSLKEDWYHFSYLSGGNPYIAKDEKERDRILRKYKGRVEEIKPGFYEIDDIYDYSWKSIKRKQKDESLKESAEWKYTLSCSDDLESAIDSGDLEEVVEALKGAYDELVDQELLDEGRRDKVFSALEQIDVYDDGAEAKVEKKLDQFYNVCDKLGVKISFNESLMGKLNEANDGVVTFDLNTDVVNSIDPGMYGSAIDFPEQAKDTQENYKMWDDIVVEQAIPYIEEAVQKTDSRIKVKNFKINHPKFYNFVSDCIDFDVELPQALLMELFEKYKNDQSFLSYLKDNYRSRDGFISTMAYTPEEFEKQCNDAQAQWKSLSQILSYNAQDEFDDRQREFEDDVLDGSYWWEKLDCYEDEYVGESLQRKSESIKEDVYKEWKPNTNWSHLKDIMKKVADRGYKYVNNEREEIMSALDLADKKQKFKPEQRKELRDFHEKVWRNGRTSNESLKEDTVKQGSSWVNKGKEGTHGKFKTKKGADAQRKAMFANGYKEGLNEGRFDYRTYPLYSFEFKDGLTVIAPNEEEAVAKHTDVVKNMHKGSPRSKEELDKIANDLYDNSDQHSFNYFSDEELALLWSMCMTTPDNHWGRAYDDEVYEAISNRANTQEIFTKAEEYLDSPKNESCKPRRKGKKLTEAPIYDLTPQYDSRQSFYSKAKVDTGDKGDKNRLYSYNTLVAEIKDGKPVVYGTYSATTLRHIKDWLRQNGFKAESAKQIMADYGTKDEALTEKRDSKEVKDNPFDYERRLLARLKSDCDYTLGACKDNGSSFEGVQKHFWAGNSGNQIAKMRELHQLSKDMDDIVTDSDIDTYEKRFRDWSKQEALTERNLTKSERYNKMLHNTFANYRAMLERMKDYLRKNTEASEEEIETAYQNTGLGNNPDNLWGLLKKYGVHDEFFAQDGKKNESVKSKGGKKPLTEGASNFWSMDGLPLLVFYTMDEALWLSDEYVDQELSDPKYDGMDEDQLEEIRDELDEKFWSELDVCVLDEEELSGLQEDIEEHNDAMLQKYYYDVEDEELYFYPEKVELKSGYYSAVQMYCNTRDCGEEEVNDHLAFFEEMKKKYGLTELGVAYRFSNGETGYSKK